MNRVEHLLFIASEECDETGQRCSKAARFGLHQVQPGHPFDNAERITHEFLDVVAAMEMLAAEGLFPPPADLMRSERGAYLIDQKKRQVERFLEEVSRPNGTLQP